MKKFCNIVTCGDVDSGKSTLLGRLLYNTDNVYEDQLKDIESSTQKYGFQNPIEYGLLFDGLLDERKQQITIDIAHRFFKLKDQRFHLFDCPGHVQYTHNFIIGAIEADIAILVIDSTKGLMPQTLKHLEICKLFKISKVILAITKIDLVDETKLNILEQNIKDNILDVEYEIFKTSAVENINIDKLADFLYEESLGMKNSSDKFVLNIQSVKKMDNERVYQGISFGELTADNNSVTIYPSRVKCNIFAEKDAVEVYSFDTDADVSRGYLISNFELYESSKINGSFLNLTKKPIGTNLIFKYGTLEVPIKHLYNNSIELAKQIYFCNIDEFKNLGYGLIIDDATKLNVGLFVFQDNEKLANNFCYWFTGYSGTGKTTLANKLIENFAVKPILLDGDEIRKTINYDLTLSDKDRDENVKKIANLANLLIKQGFNVVVACISKDLRQRNYAKDLLKESYVEIFVESSDETRKKRDTKGLYKNNIKPLDNYEPSPWDYIKINTDDISVEQSTVELIQKLLQKNYL